MDYFVTMPFILIVTDRSFKEYRYDMELSIMKKDKFYNILLR
jgi:hypothetical protein